MSLRFEVRDLRYLLEEIWFPIKHNNGNNRFDTLCNTNESDNWTIVDDVNYILKSYIPKLRSKNLFNDDYLIDDPIVIRNLKKYIKREKVKGMSFYTIVPKERLKYDAFTIGHLAGFCELMFNERGSKYFKQCWYVVESGKHQQKPNLHIHLLADFKKMGSKFFLRDLKTLWRKHFPDEKYTINYNVDGNKGIDRVDCNTLEIQQDKITYMDNDCKGTHENFTDLGIHKHFEFEG